RRRIATPEARREAMRRRGAVIPRLLTAALAVLAVTACQAIPASGPVREGLSDFNQAEQQVQFNPDGPAVGATQEEIVRGFVLAASSSADEYAVAREFLAPTYRDEWDPSLGVFVDEGSQDFHSEGDNIGLLSLSGIAT